MEESILSSVKHGVGGITAEYTAFDQDIIMHINSTFFVLNQLGVGPAEPVVISDASTTWDAFDNIENLEAIKSYVVLKVKSLFDPPSNSALLSALKENIAEYEFRLNVADDTTE